MKKYKFFLSLLIFFILFASISLYAQTLNLSSLLARLSKPRLTSLQKLDLVEQYKGQNVRGRGKVKDIVKSYDAKNEAVVYLQKRFRDKEYEIVLTVNRETAERIKKRRTITFEGVFDDMGFDTLRFNNAKIIRKRWWLF